MEPEMKRKLAAILVADVVGYSRLIADDEEATLRRLETFRGLWQECLTKTGGRIFNTAGDAVLAEFQSAVEAVRCALDFQVQAKAQNDGLVPARQMHFRVGITIGDVVERHGDLLGDGVNVAARLQTLAGPGGVCVSSWVREAVANKLGAQFTDLGDQTVKNIPAPIRAYLVGGAIAGAAATATAKIEKQDWLGRAVSSWRGMGMLLGVSAVGVASAFLLVSQLSSSKPADGPVKPVTTAPITKTTKTEPPATQTTPPGSLPKTAASDPPPSNTSPSKSSSGKLPAQPSTPPVDPNIKLGMLSEAAEQELRVGDRFKECETCPEMVVMPRNEFVMGSAPGQTGHEPDEGPTRKVTLGTRIAVARYAISVGEYETFVALTGYRPGAGCRIFDAGQWNERNDLSFRNPGFSQGPDHPVVCVNWSDAKAFTDWMTARMNADYRLPTEAEREYFTRGGTSTAFWWGNDIDPRRASYDWSAVLGGSPKAEPKRGTFAVNAFQPNPWGLYQVHGNVSEWVEDCWNDSYKGAPSDGSAWTSGDCKRRILRGGSWGYSPKDLRSAYREGATSTNRNFNFGFRVVRVLRGAK
jgi:formylglycine-generating enzyme required for sulfatase activity/class 3 adenylate cyclase